MAVMASTEKISILQFITTFEDDFFIFSREKNEKHKSFST